MLHWRPEQYFPLAFLVITFLNLGAVALLVAGKGIRSRRESVSKRRLASFRAAVTRAAEGKYQDLAGIRTAVRSLKIRELREGVEALSRDGQKLAIEACAHEVAEACVTDRLLAAAGNGHRWRKIDALVVLGHFRNAQALLLLRRALRSGDADVVWGAVLGLAAWDTKQAVEVLVSLLGRDCPINPSRVATAVEGSTADVADALIRKAESNDPSARFWAATLLSKFPRKLTQQTLRTLAADRDLNVRAAAFASLARTGDGLNDATLISGLTDTEWVVRAQAARACGERRLAEALPKLVQLLRDREWWVRADAREAIEKIGPAALDHLVPALSDGDRFARNMAAQALDNMGYVDAAIWDLAKGGAERDRAVRVLGALRRAEGAPALADKIHRLNPALLAELGEPLGLTRQGGAA